jgi:hypothetical protein
VRVEFGDTTVLGQKPLADNVLGEMGIRILLSQWLDDATGKAASQGWRGDRYLVYDDGKAMIWQIVLDSKQTALNFDQALHQYAEKRFGHFVWMPDSPGESSGSSPLRTVRIFWIPSTNQIVFINAAKEEWASALVKKFVEKR